MGYLFTGAGAILTLPAYWLKKSIPFRVLVAFVLLVGAAVWLVTGFGSYWAHPESFAKWPAGGRFPAPSGN